jgi:heme-degrading monooxygenase HmoA
MYVSMSHLRVDAGRAGELVEAFRNRIGLVDSADGFVDLEVWQADSDPCELIMVSRWRDREAFKSYMKSQEHQRSHERVDPDLQDAIKLTRLGHLHTYEVVAR